VLLAETKPLEDGELVRSDGSVAALFNNFRGDRGIVAEDGVMEGVQFCGQFLENCHNGFRGHLDAIEALPVRANRGVQKVLILQGSGCRIFVD